MLSQIKFKVDPLLLILSKDISNVSTENGSSIKSDTTLATIKLSSNSFKDPQLRFFYILSNPIFFPSEQSIYDIHPLVQVDYLS